MAINSHQTVPEALDGIFQQSEPLSINPCSLSGREAEILALAILGLTDEQISRKLDIRFSTVSSYWVRIRSKLGSYSRTQIVSGVLTFEHQRKVGEFVAEIASLRAQLRSVQPLPEEAN